MLPWVHWRGFVVLALLLAGNFFCMACPFMLPRRLAKRLLPGDRPVPGWLRAKWVALALLVVFFWAYEAFDLWASPWLTAWIVVAYFAGAFVVDGFFRGAAFCKHVCPIGQFNFVNGLVSPGEVRVRDAGVCAACETKDCIRGRWEPQPAPAGTFAGRQGRVVGAPGHVRPDRTSRLVQNGCELWLYQPRKAGNMDCTFCLDCVQACPHDNVGMMLGLPGRDLWRDPVRSGVGRFSGRLDLAALAVVLTFAAYVNTFGMVAPVGRVEAWLAGIPGLAAPWAPVAAIFVLGLVALPLLLTGGAALLTARAGAQGSLSQVATRYVWALVPVGFGMWAAHYLFHFLVAAPGSVTLLLGRLPGLGPYAPQGGAMGPLLPEAWLLPLQLVLLEAGALLSVVVAHRIARRDVGRSRAGRAFLPWAGVAVALSLAGMWLLTRPMEMRGMPGMAGMHGMGG